MKYLISGTGRSGTTLIHSVLESLGVDIGRHEISMGNAGGVGGYRVIPNMTCGEEYGMIVQIRDPIETINSVLKSSPSDFPELGLYKKDYADLEVYVLNAWYKIHTKLIEKSVLVYTLENLNNGDVTEQLIDLYDIKCTPENFNNRLLNKMNTPSRNTRTSIRPNTTIESLNIKAPILIEKTYNLYNQIKDHAYKKT